MGLEGVRVLLGRSWRRWDWVRFCGEISAAMVVMVGSSSRSLGAVCIAPFLFYFGDFCTKTGGRIEKCETFGSCRLFLYSG